MEVMKFHLVQQKNTYTQGPVFNSPTISWQEMEVPFQNCSQAASQTSQALWMGGHPTQSR
jgi:hypothetical protein